jgi:hypothetical protein
MFWALDARGALDGVLRDAENLPHIVVGKPRTTESAC